MDFKEWENFESISPNEVNEVKLAEAISQGENLLNVEYSVFETNAFMKDCVSIFSNFIKKSVIKNPLEEQ